MLRSNNSLPDQISLDINIYNTTNLIILRIHGDSFTIDWGDSTINSTPCHRYTKIGCYHVEIRGENIYCFQSYANGMFSINLHCDNLKTLYCSCNQLTNLDVSGCPKLSVLLCDYNGLQNLTLENLIHLRILDCSNNELKRIKLPSSLTSLDCSTNYLRELDISACQLLKHLDVSYNFLLKKEALNIVKSLPEFYSIEGKITISPYHSVELKNKLKKKGWLAINKAI